MRSLSTRATGLIIVVLGVWGGLVPFVGPYFHFTLGPTKAWTWTSGRFYLDVLPGIVAVLGGLMLMSAGPRRSARVGALLAMAAGFWFAIGPEVSLLWNAGGAQGAAHGARFVRMLEPVAYHSGLGALIAALAGYALPRFPARKVVEAETVGTAGRATRTGAGAGTAVGAGAAGIAARRRHGDDLAAEDDAVTRREPVIAEDEAMTRRHEPIAAEDRYGDDRYADDARYPGGARGAVDEPTEARAESAAIDEPVHDPAGARASGNGVGTGMSTPDASTAGNGTSTAGNGTSTAGNGTSTTGDSETTRGAPATSGGTTVRRRQGGLLSSLLRR
jgi:hypothetical protein